MVVAPAATVNTPDPPTVPALAGLHPRLTVLETAATDRAALVDRVTELAFDAADGDGRRQSRAVGPFGRDDLDASAKDAARRRVEEHARRREDLSTRLRRAREQQAVIANRRDEAAARVRRLTAHLTDCDSLLERADELTSAAEEARRTLDVRRAEVTAVGGKLSLVEEQREAAARTIEDASAQLRDLEAAELDETSLRRELESARSDLRTAEDGFAETEDVVRAIEQAAAGRAATQEHLLHERAALVQRIEAPLYDTEPVRAALAAFDDETVIGESDLVARELARECIEVESELARIEAALPLPPSDDELVAAEQRLLQIEQTIGELETVTSHAQLPVDDRDDIEEAHEAVLVAEEEVDDSGGDPDAVQRLNEAREAEHAVLQRFGFDTYLDVILTGPRPEADTQTELLDALRARRVAEDTLASLRAASEPPQIVIALRTRQDRIYREAADLLCCDPGDNVAELLYAHPVVPPNRTRALATVLASYGIAPIGISVREMAVAWLVEQDQELVERGECRREVEALDRELDALEDEEASAAEQAQRAIEMVHIATAEVEMARHRVQTLERELHDRTSQDERRLQRVAAAEQLRAQIAAVTDALERSNEEYHSALQATEAAVTAAEISVERATAALSDAVRRLRRIAEALPPALRPRAGDDPLGELPRLRQTLAGEVDRAELALAGATSELERARADVDDTQAQLEAHLTEVPPHDVTDADLRQAVLDLIGVGDAPVVLDELFDKDERPRHELLDAVAAAAEGRPIVYLTADSETLGWAIGLPAEIGTVTRLGMQPALDSPHRAVPLPARSGPVGPRT